ncbi:hypothetical protein GCM10009799_25760 [Nocardiopsis rhodophaea]|uniref:Uncharacterized protein n=1 Tax=Nocardiopsis rhodophaea TaxID=280238 RepID=A0ABN2T2Z2_9ACTN
MPSDSALAGKTVSAPLLPAELDPLVPLDKHEVPEEGRDPLDVAHDSPIDRRLFFPQSEQDRCQVAGVGVECQVVRDVPGLLHGCARACVVEVEDPASVHHVRHGFEGRAQARRRCQGERVESST